MPPKIISVVPILSIRAKIIPIPALWNWNNTGTNNGIGHDYNFINKIAPFHQKK